MDNQEDRVAVSPEILERLDKCRKVSNEEELDLSDLHLFEIPADALRMSKLRSLNLRNNRLTSLPEKFVDIFPNLEILNISSNRLSNLPVDIGLLKHLRKLYLQNNRITGLPDSVSRLQRLEELYAQHNHLEEIRDGLSYAQGLTTLSLAHNHLKMIPHSLASLVNLSIVDLSGNTLGFVPERIRRLHDKHALLHSRQRRRELISRALRVRQAVSRNIKSTQTQDKLRTTTLENA